MMSWSADGQSDGHVAAQQVMEVPGPDAYMPHALHLGLVSTDPSVVLTADSFQAVRTKARHLAILCGFQIRMAKGGSNRRRGWLCGSADGCPFSIFAHRNKRGIQIRANLAHNHAFHLPQDQGKRFTTATTEELACYVRQSAIYQQSTNINKLTGKQISDAIFAHTGRHVKANRASVIKKLLVHHPERVVPCASLFQNPSTTSMAPTHSAPPSTPLFHLLQRTRSLCRYFPLTRSTHPSRAWPKPFGTALSTSRILHGPSSILA
ncbi:hypothetical protein H310_06721 [Aphanomyces invadans]|uniref:Uncharacterized protein n=1 Tax=Aphanomyces invadans TaxID=157072 RepID=A0A024U3V0_9STRA|nr:hypothetical protein H310_06721 [Aphanomyces invadans]ETW01106.1 hypothetical protein H310_06721 [Aphanomyces invadans]|eukprot:XP_008870104.1 hypothetical protein H310_06721 [Aphanomyces invadans]